MRLQAILFGIGTLDGSRDVEREAYNRVFQEAGLPWRWDACTYARLNRQAVADDVLDAFIRSDERPRWRNSDDLQHLLAAVRRRHAAVCREISAEPAAADREMIALAEAAGARQLRTCAIWPSGDALPQGFRRLACAQSHLAALAALDLPAAACVALECTAEGFDAASNGGIVTFDKLAISPGSDATRETAVLALLEDVHARAKSAAAPPRTLSMALIA
jgi:hypothetical protein